MVAWVGLHCVVVVFPDHTHLHFLSIYFINGNDTMYKVNSLSSNHKSGVRLIKTTPTYFFAF